MAQEWSKNGPRFTDDDDDGGWVGVDTQKKAPAGSYRVRAVQLTVVEASNLPVPGRFRRIGQGQLPPSTPAPGLNPFAVVKHSESRRVTRVSIMNAYPKWGSHFEFALDVGSITAERPARQPDHDITIEVLNEDKFTSDSIIGTLILSPTKIDGLLAQGTIGAAVKILEQLSDPSGLPLYGGGGQPSLLALQLEIIEVEVQNEGAAQEAVPSQAAENKENQTRGLPVMRSPQKLKEDSDLFFQKLQGSPIWRGRKGDTNAHVYLDTPDLPFEKYEERDAKSILASCGILEHQIALLKMFVDGLGGKERLSQSGARKKVIWKELAGLGVDKVSLGVMFGADAQADDSVLELTELLALLAREPAMARGIVEELGRPRVDVDKLIIEAEEANKAVAILKKFSIMPSVYNLHDRDAQVWARASDKMKTGLEKSVLISTACQADVDPFEGDLFIHYQQLAPNERKFAQGPTPVEGRASRPSAHLPAASTRPPAMSQGVRVSLLEGRQLSQFEGPPGSSLRNLGDIHPPPPCPADIQSQISIMTKSANAEGVQESRTETVHQFSHTGVRMLEAALRPGAWYTNSRTQPGTMAAFPRANYWAKGTPPL